MNSHSPYSIEPFFLPFGKELIFCLYLAPTTAKPRAAVLYLPPLAEEMHKSRRMAALQARQFAKAGYAVLQIDLPGCGDSSGDFQDASWETWLSCARTAHGWLKQKAGTPTVLWGLRLGAVLAVELSSQLPEIAGLVLWQPVVSGENLLNQFLRIKVASEMLTPQQSKVGIKELRNTLESGEAVEIGGYLLGPRLALGIDKLRLAQFTVQAPVHWLEVSQNPTDSPVPASLKVIDTWTKAGIKVYAQVIPGNPFWTTQEIAECPGLLSETSKALDSIMP